MSEVTPEQATRKSARVGEGELIGGRYRVARQIGRGGFATVYEGVQINLNQPVAIKLLDNRSDKPELFVERFLREARTVTQIRHPDIVKVMDFGVTDAGDAYMVMELLDGLTLEDELRRLGALEPERSVRLMIRALDALQAAHALGIVHRDLKPANLFLSGSGTLTEALRLLDFGIAKVVETDEERLTGTGQLLGTPSFLPPEYIIDQTVTPALDVYQMGLILVQMLTGRSVVGGRTLYQSMLAHCSGDLDIPDELLASSLGPVVARSITMALGDRFADAGQFRDALMAVPTQSLPRRDQLALPADSTEVMFAETEDSVAVMTPRQTGKVIQAMARGEVFGERPDGGASEPTLDRMPPALLGAVRPSSDAAPEPEERPSRLPVIALGLSAALVLLGGVVGALAWWSTLEEPAAIAAAPDVADSVIAEAAESDVEGADGLTAAPPAPTPDASAVPDIVPAEPAAPRVVTIEASPASARIFDGERLLGKGRAELRFEGADRAPITVRVEARRYTSQTVEITPDQPDDRVAVTLAPIRRGGAAPAEGGKAPADPAADGGASPPKEKKGLGFIEDDAQKNKKKPDSGSMGVFQ